MVVGSAARGIFPIESVPSYNIYCFRKRKYFALREKLVLLGIFEGGQPKALLSPKGGEEYVQTASTQGRVAPGPFN